MEETLLWMVSLLATVDNGATRRASFIKHMQHTLPDGEAKRPSERLTSLKNGASDGDGGQI